jgi:hypothetical protein
VLESDYPANHYDGLNAQAIALWQQFLRLYQDQFDSFSYNVRVGQGLDPGPGASEAMRKMWYSVTTKRIDVVATRQNQTWVIEIEPRPGMRTLGQLVGYMSLLPKYQTTRPVIIAALVCQYLGFDMFGIFHGLNHLIFKFQPGQKPNLPPQFLPSVAGTDYTVAQS